MMKVYRLISVCLLFLIASVYTESSVAQSLSGTTGLFHIPTAQMMPDRTIMTGLNQIPAQYSLYGRGIHDNRSGFVTITFLPRLELMFRYTYMLGVERGPDISLFMDRMVAGRLLVLRETGSRPALLLGVHDPGLALDLTVNKYFGANYLVSSKNLDAAGFSAGLHMGYAFKILNEETQVFDGIFGGVSLSYQQFPWFQIMAEHDSFRWNAGAKLLLLNRIQIMAGLMELKRPAGGISYRVTL